VRSIVVGAGTLLPTDFSCQPPRKGRRETMAKKVRKLKFVSCVCNKVIPVKLTKGIGATKNLREGRDCTCTIGAVHKKVELVETAFSSLAEWRK